MDCIMKIAKKHNLIVVEDAAQAIDSYYKEKPLGSIGHLSTFSFHETKNITSGEGGMLCINDERFIPRAEIIWEKGTNRAEFFRGEANKYGWVDTGSSFLPSEVVAAFLWAQLEYLEKIQLRRKQLWEMYYSQLLPIANKVSVPHIPDYATNNAHMFYLICNNSAERTALIQLLNKHNIQAVFHYQSLHNSSYYKDKHDGRNSPECNRYADCLIRLPMFYDLKEKEITHICHIVKSFFQ